MPRLDAFVADYASTCPTLQPQNWPTHQGVRHGGTLHGGTLVVFGGAVGYLGWHGEMDMSIAIRTCVIRHNKVYVQAGAGLVADSNPESEWNETQIKARAVIKAVELSSNGLIL